jgi:hypothetical protein
MAASPDVGLVDYMKEMKMKVVKDKTGTIKLLRTVGDYNITLSFVAESEDPDEMAQYQQDPQLQQPKVEGGEQESKEDEEGPEDRLPAHVYEIDIKCTAATEHNWIKIAAMTSKHGVFLVQGLHLDPTVSHSPSASDPTDGGLPSPSLNGGLTGLGPESSAFADIEASRLFFEDLSETAQDKLMEFLHSLGIDDRLGQFVQHYAQVARTQQYLDKLKMFKEFLQN